jgi:23S rRNA (adenine2030-N6)-methyltransferase
MNYRHTFHAGNFGDVLKHATLISLFGAMQRKEKGFVYVDTHAGTGSYDLMAEAPGRTQEFVDGIGRLWKASALPGALEPLVGLVRRFNEHQGVPTGELRRYPGSPAIAAMLRREQDRLALSELHPEDFETLRRELCRQPRTSIQRIDAYSAVRAHLPAPERRALVLIDPPYEDANEVSRLHEGLVAGLERMPATVFAVWYPIKDRSGSNAFHALMQTLDLPPTLAVELTVRADDRADRLNGSGLLVLNPPWQIERDLEAIALGLRELLALDAHARASVEWLVPER